MGMIHEIASRKHVSNVREYPLAKLLTLGISLDHNDAFDKIKPFLALPALQTIHGAALSDSASSDRADISRCPTLNSIHFERSHIVMDHLDSLIRTTSGLRTFIYRIDLHTPYKNMAGTEPRLVLDSLRKYSSLTLT